MTSAPEAIEPHPAEQYEVGAILEHSWGYDQTNIDFFVVLNRVDKPSGDTWLTLQALTTTSSRETGFMTGDCEPGVIDESAKPIRRKLHKWEDQERGVAIESYGWCSLWDGKPSNWTAYA